MNIKYVKHYDNLKNLYSNKKDCVDNLVSIFKNEISNTINIAYNNDPLSKLGTYKRINTLLNTYTCDNGIPENDRILLCRYRTGSHRLKVETLRWRRPIISRENRFCQCLTETQDIDHIVLRCSLLENFRPNVNSVQEFINLDEHSIILFLKNCERILDLG